MSGSVGRQMTSVQRNLLKRRPIIGFRSLFSLLQSYFTSPHFMINVKNLPV